MLKVLFFAHYRDALKTDEIQLSWNPAWTRMRDVHQHLLQQGPPWQVLEDPGLMCARNQSLCKLDSKINQGDELAFFPTVTGG